MRAARNSLLLAACLAPAALALWWVYRFTVNVPMWDEWQYLQLLRASYESHVNWQMLFAQHNEHRILVPRLVMLGLDHLSHYDNRWELYAAWGCLAGVALLCFAEIRRVQPRYALLAAAPMSAMVFTLRQYENLIWGMQITLMLCVFFAAAALALLASSRRMALAPAAICAVAASFCFFNGLLIWPAGAVQLAAARRWRVLPAWCGAGAATTAIYLWGYVKPGHHPSLTSFLHQRLAGLPFFLAAAGNSMSETERAGICYGSLVALFALVLLWRSLRDGTGQTMAPGLIAFAAGTWAALTLGRAGFGVEQALTSRYASFTLLGVCGIYLTALRTRSHAIAAVTASMIFLGAIDNDNLAVLRGPGMRAGREVARDSLLSYEVASDARLGILSQPAMVREEAPFLRDRKLSAFARSGSLPDFSLESIAGAPPTVPVRLAALEADVKITGWAVDRASKQLLTSVKVVFDGRELRTRYGVARLDVASILHDPALSASGFEALLRATALVPGPHRLQVLVTNREGITYEEPEQLFTVETR